MANEEAISVLNKQWQKLDKQRNETPYPESEAILKEQLQIEEAIKVLQGNATMDSEPLAHSDNARLEQCNQAGLHGQTCRLYQGHLGPHRGWRDDGSFDAVWWGTDGPDFNPSFLKGNPGEGTLHDMLADVADHVDYEAEVVEQAADDIDDSAIANAAHKQAEAMEDAAEALDDAADAARETAAEVFNESGIPQDEFHPDEEQEEVLVGNPQWPDSEFADYSDQELAMVRSDWLKSLDHPMPPEQKQLTEAYIAHMEDEIERRGHPSSEQHPQGRTVEGNPTTLDGTLYGNPATNEDGEELFVGTSGMECVKCGAIVRWDDLETHYFVKHEEVVEGNPVVAGVKAPVKMPQQTSITGNPSPQMPVSVNTPLPVNDAPHLVPVAPQPPPPNAVDQAPEPSHWYTKPMFGRK